MKQKNLLPVPVRYPINRIKGFLENDPMVFQWLRDGGFPDLRQCDSAKRAAEQSACLHTYPGLIRGINAYQFLFQVSEELENILLLMIFSPGEGQVVSSNVNDIETKAQTFQYRSLRS
jgi:hypothetical protein